MPAKTSSFFQAICKYISSRKRKLLSHYFLYNLLYFFSIFTDTSFRLSNFIFCNWKLLFFVASFLFFFFRRHMYFCSWLGNLPFFLTHHPLFFSLSIGSHTGGKRKRMYIYKHISPFTHSIILCCIVSWYCF